MKGIYMGERINKVCECNDMYLENGEAWYIGMYDSILYRWDLSSEYCECITSIPNMEKAFIAYSCVKYNNKIICFPFRNENIWVYDLDTKSFRQIDVKRQGYATEELLMYTYWLDGEILWVWSSGLKCLVEIDLQNMTVENFYTISKNFPEEFGDYPIKVDNMIYVLATGTGVLYEFDIVTKKIESYEITGAEKNINSVCFDGTYFWFTGCEKRIYIWDKQTEKIIRYIDISNELKKMEDETSLCFCKSIDLKNHICFIPYPGTDYGKVFFVDKRTYEVREVKLHGDANEYKNICNFEYIIDERYIGINYLPGDCISEIDTEDFSVKMKKILIDTEQYNTLVLKNKLKKGIAIENTNDDLQALLNLLKGNEV